MNYDAWLIFNHLRILLNFKLILYSKVLKRMLGSFAVIFGSLTGASQNIFPPFFSRNRMIAMLSSLLILAHTCKYALYPVQKFNKPK